MCATILERDFVALEPNTKWVVTLAEARADVFDYIERFHNPRLQRRLDAQTEAFNLLTQPSVKTG